MQVDSVSGSVTVVMHTYERPEYVSEDVAAGRWTGVPLLIMDDASSEEVQDKLRKTATAAGGRFGARASNGGPSLAARDGVVEAGTPQFVLCGDDDYLKEFGAFASEASALIEQDDVLLVTMPEVWTLVGNGTPILQYDRRNLDGLTGRELLRRLVFDGEMRALQAGTLMRSAEAIPLFASGLFRTSEDFVLICRLCAAHPDRVVRVLDHGAYMRREHPKSLSHRSNMSTERGVVNLLSLLVGIRLLQQIETVEMDIARGLIRSRGGILAGVYGSGSGAAWVVESLLEGRVPEADTKEVSEALTFLIDRQDDLPAELAVLRSVLAEVRHPNQSSAIGSLPDDEAIETAARLLDSGDLEGARTVCPDKSPADDRLKGPWLAVKARLSWAAGDVMEAARLLAQALVVDPEDKDSLHLLAQVYGNAGEKTIAARLENRLFTALGNEVSARLGVVRHPDVPDTRVAFIVSDGLDQFLDDLIRECIPHLDARKFAVKTKQDILEAMEWAEVCWFEWCNDPLIWASRQDLAADRVLLCRLHRYEAFSEMPLRVRWEHVDALMVVAEHLADIVAEKVPGIRRRTSIHHIPNGVDMDRYELMEREPGHDLAFIGYLHGRKNPGLALQILHQLVQKDDRYRLHVAGKFQDPVIELYWSHMVQRLGLTDHVIMYAWQDDIAAFLEDKQYLLSTSQHESFGYSIAEAMARGIKPVVHDFPFASDMWAEEMLFASTDQAVEQILSSDYQSKAYRGFVQNHFSLDQQVRSTLALIQSALTQNRSPLVQDVTQVHSLEPRMVNAEVVGTCPNCAAECRVQQQTIGGHPVGHDRCPSCGTSIRVGLEAYRKALEQYRDQALTQDLRAATREVRSVALGWTSAPPWKELMTLDGIDLGALMEYELTPHLVRAAMQKAQEAAAE